MAVYVDDMQAPLGGMKMCHMIADSREELLAMADVIGVSHRWIQFSGTYREHFDISLEKRTFAVEAGAIELTRMALGRIVYARRKAK